MSQNLDPNNPLKINVRVSGALKDHVARSVGDGDYENISEYVRDLIRKDKTAHEDSAFERLKATLQSAFAAPDTAYENVTAKNIRARAARLKK